MPYTRLHLFALSLTLTASYEVWGQRTVTTQNQQWVHYFLTARFAEKAYLTSEASFRTRSGFSEASQSVLGAGLMYRPAPTLSLQTNVAYFTAYAQAPATVNRPEWRVYHAILLQGQKYGKLTVSHRYRVEERFFRKANSQTLEQGFDLECRLRYQLQLQYPLKGDKVDYKIPYLFLTEEIFLHLGKNILTNTFDQNRITAGLGLMFIKNFTCTLGYLHIYQQRASGSNYNSIHTLRLALIHTPDWRKKQKDNTNQTN